MRGHTCKVIVIGGERGAERVRAQLRERLGVVPRLMQRLDPGTGPPACDDDPRFSLERHVIDRGALDEAGLSSAGGQRDGDAARPRLSAVGDGRGVAA